MGQCTSKSPVKKTQPQPPTVNGDNQKNDNEKILIELNPTHDEESKEQYEKVLIEESREPDIESLAKKEFTNKIVSLKIKLQNEKNDPLNNSITSTIEVERASSVQSFSDGMNGSSIDNTNKNYQNNFVPLVNDSYVTYGSNGHMSPLLINEYSYDLHHASSEYSHPTRSSRNINGTLLHSSNIRKMKMYELMNVKKQQEDKELTFKPAINKNYKSNSKNTKPVYDRLYEKGQSYREIQDSRIQHNKEYDEFGNKLFQPVITNRYNLNDEIPNLEVDTYLYKDAKDREARQKLRQYEDEQMRYYKANASKLNYKSAEILYNKADRSSRLIFLALDNEENGYITSENILRLVSKLSDKQKYPLHMIHDITEIIWTEIMLLASSLGNEYVSGDNKLQISMSAFVKVCTPVLAVTSDLQPLEMPTKVVTMSATTSTSSNNNNLNPNSSNSNSNRNFQNDNLKLLKSLLAKKKANLHKMYSAGHSNESSPIQSSSTDYNDSPSHYDKEEIDDMNTIEVNISDEVNKSVSSVSSDGNEENTDNNNRMTSINNPNNPYVNAVAGVGKSHMTQGQKALLQFLRYMSELVYNDRRKKVRYIDGENESSPTRNTNSRLRFNMLNQVLFEKDHDHINNNNDNDNNNIYTTIQSDKSKQTSSGLSISNKRSLTPTTRRNEILAEKRDMQERNELKNIISEAIDKGFYDEHILPMQSARTNVSKSSILESVDSLSRTDLMHARSTLIAHRKKQKRDEIMLKEKQQCTFQPNVASTTSVGSTTVKRRLSKHATSTSNDMNQVAWSVINDSTEIDDDNIKNKYKYPQTIHEDDKSYSNSNNTYSNNITERSGTTNTTQTTTDIHTRLYTNAVKQKQKLDKREYEKQLIQEAEYQEMKENMFKPKLEHSFAYRSQTPAFEPFEKSLKHDKSFKSFQSDSLISNTNFGISAESMVDVNNVTIYDIKSMDTFLERKEKARQMISEQHEREKAKFHFDDDTYIKSREIAREGPIPFQFPTDARRLSKKLNISQTFVTNPTTDNNYTNITKENTTGLFSSSSSVSVLNKTANSTVQHTRSGLTTSKSSRSIMSHKSSKSSKSFFEMVDEAMTNMTSTSSPNSPKQGNMTTSESADPHKYMPSSSSSLPSPPQLIIDVKLGPNRIKHITIKNGDNPQTLATQFCKLYSLDPSACSLLVELIQQNMENNNLEIFSS